ncbi:hypothetical protein RRG08_042046 [Elysia crispata]|uniref:Uncharacterized protein n=1 Tax=Elysia crispata TaxID=231223 RepID=A0AAE0Z9D6_9GAST|nr:hypothetical protein RRG08_042046 [Elysia crispata]
MRGIAIFALALTLVKGQIDLTRDKGAAGADVVEATLQQIRESCIFPSDYLFLRRVAYVMTKDGTGPDTYRIGFDGGIWQINQTEFALTKTSTAISQYWAPIKAAFNIDWATVQWSDLRRPLYSGIAAMLTLLRVSAGNVPRALERQAAFWQANFLTENPRAAFEFLSETQNLDGTCTTNILDMAFIVDSSTSLSPEDFERAKQFASDVTGQFTVDPNNVRVAFVTYSSGYRANFDFQRYTTTSDVQTAILAVQKTEGGTDTDLALKYAANSLFTAQAGSRPSAARVVVIITDGRSDNKIDAYKNSQMLKDRGITVFVIGVGNQVDRQELDNLASNPTCTHVQELQQYSELDSLKTEIKDLSCKALVTLDNGVYNYPCGQRTNFQVNPVAVRSIVVRPSTGSVRVYGSHTNPQPNDAFRDFVAVATPTNAATVYVTDATRPLYISIQSNNPGECVTNYQIDVVPFNALNKNSMNVCIKKDVTTICTTLDVLRGMYPVTQPSNLGFPNKCSTNTPGLYPHPYSPYRFLYCDYEGQAYLVDCPAGFYYNDQVKDCVKGVPPTPPPSTRRPVTVPITMAPPRTFPTMQPNTATPGVTTQYPLQPFPICTLENYRLGLHFFEWAANETKYIMCSEYPGMGRLKDCAPYHKWSQVSQACIYKDVVIDWTRDIYQTTAKADNYGCTPGLKDDSLFYHAHPYDNSKFIQCDEFGDAFILDCPANEIWYQDVQNCLPGVRNVKSG